MLLSKEERKEINAITEQNFIKSIHTDSYEKAVETFHSCYETASDLVNKVVDGEIIDETQLKIAVQQMIYSYRYAERKRIEVTGSHLVNPGNIQVPKDNIEASMKANELLGKYAQEKVIDDLERGMWMLRMAQNY